MLEHVVQLGLPDRAAFLGRVEQVAQVVAEEQDVGGQPRRVLATRPPSKPAGDVFVAARSRRYVELRVDVRSGRWDRDARPTAARLQIGGSDFVLAEWVDDNDSRRRRRAAAPHLADDEAWYVLEGSLGFVRGDERSRRRGRPCSSPRLRAPSGTRHGRALLIVLTPRIAALIEAIHEPGAIERPAGAVPPLRLRAPRGTPSDHGFLQAWPAKSALFQASPLLIRGRPAGTFFLHRARSASRSKPLPRAVGGSRRFTGKVDESATGSVNFWSDTFVVHGSRALFRTAFAEVSANCGKGVRQPLAPSLPGLYLPSCSEHGARVGRSRSWGR